MKSGTNPEQKLAQAWRLLQQGKIARADALCRRVLKKESGHAAATHLLGLIRKAAGDGRQAAYYMRASVRLAPEVAEYHSNLGNLLRESGEFDEAVQCYRRAVAIDASSKPARVGLVRALSDLGRHDDAEVAARDFVTGQPTDATAWSLLAMTVRDQGRLEDAGEYYRKALALKPGYALAQHNLGSVLSRMDRAEEALEELQRARSLGVSGYEIDFNFGRTYLQLYRFDAAERAFECAIKARPLDSDAQINLARVRFMRGEKDFARDIEAAAATQEGDSRFRALFGIMLQRAGAFERAESYFRDLLAKYGSSADAQSALAEVLHETGRLEEAEPLVLDAVRQRPNDSIIVENAVAILLARGKPERAVPYIDEQRARSPFGQGWLAYEATASRLLGTERYAELYDYDRLVRVYDVEAPSGWSSIDELNDALRRALDARHRLPGHPLDQSLRNGSQTARSLLTDPDPAIRAIIEAFEAPVDDYRGALGTDPDHPISVRNRDRAKITGAWSVKLRREGFHVNHFHPEGWISSAYYISAPDEVRDESGKSGWIKFGEPRFPVPGATPERFLQPRAARLVLFPSYMWHGTNPIHGDDSRLTVAFDAIPASEPGTAFR